MYELIDPARLQALYRRVRNDPKRRARVFEIIERTSVSDFVSDEDIVTIELMELDNEREDLGQRTVGGHRSVL